MKKPIFRHCFQILLFPLVFVGTINSVRSQELTYEFTNFVMGEVGATAFTTNNFTSAGVDGQNRIWVGSQYGGLYTKDETASFWVKSPLLTNVFINDIATDGNGEIWIAQAGTTSSGGNSNLGGGLNHFPTTSIVDMKFYTIPGGANNGNLFSRNARSVYVNPSQFGATGALPKVWVAQGTFITNFNTQRGGVNFGMNAQPPFTIRNVQGFSILSGTPICESVDGNGTEIWVGVRQNQGRSQILRYKNNGDLIGEYSHLNTPALPNGFFPNAIHFDNADNKWIGLREGGVRIVTAGTDVQWITANTANMPNIFPSGTQVNHNAIVSDDIGNVYIGTSNGLVIFRSQEYFGTNPANESGYTRVTTEQGLINNNVKGMAFDKKNKRLVIATAGGISFLKTRPDNIVGTVFNVATGLNSTSRPSSDLIKTTPPQGFTVKLLDGNSVVEEKIIVGSSIYEFDEAEDETDYTIEIEYERTEGKNLTYTFNNIRNQTFVPSVKVPETLLLELDTLKPILEKQCIDFSLIFGLKIPNICNLVGFNVADYNIAGSKFQNSENLMQDEIDQLNNLANYLATLHAANKMGGFARELDGEAIAPLLDLIQFAFEELALGKSIKEFLPEDENPIFQSGLGEEGDKIIISRLKFLKEGANLTMKKIIAGYRGDAELKKNMETALTILNDGLEVLITLMESGKGRGVFETFNAQFKKLIAQVAAVGTHKLFYLNDRHYNLVPLTSNNSLNKVSKLDFKTVFDNVNNPGTESLVAVAQTQLDEKKNQIGDVVAFSNMVGAGADMADASSKIALIPGFQVAGGIFKTLAIGGKVIKGVALLTGTGLGMAGSKEIRDSSEKIRYKAGFEQGGSGGQPAEMGLMANNAALSHGVLSTTDSVTARAVRLNQHLTQLNGFYQSGTWQPVPFGNSFKAWRIADSLLIDAMSEAFLQLQPYLEDAYENISGFEPFYQVTIDSFFDKKTQFDRSLYYNTLAWMFVDDQSTESGSLDSIVTELRKLNDSLANRIAILTSMVDNSSVVADAYLEKINWTYNHSNAPGSTGSVSFTFKNVGPVPLQNLRFLLEPLTAGYTTTKPDSVFGGTIAPGQTIQYSFNFTSPQHDTMGRYHLVLAADNGRIPEITGSLIVVNPNKVFSVKEGNWSNPATWSGGQVPLSTHDVQVGHKVNVDANVSCKSLNVTLSGDLQVLPNRKVTILQ